MSDLAWYFHGRSLALPNFGKRRCLVVKLNLAIAVSMNRSIEAGRCFSGGLFVGCSGNESGGISGFEDIGEFSFDVLIISLRLKQRDRRPTHSFNYHRSSFINHRETNFFSKSSINPSTNNPESGPTLQSSRRPLLLTCPRSSIHRRLSIPHARSGK